jgi:hypothetical protein
MFDMSGDSGVFRNAEQMEGEGWTREATDWVREGDTGLDRRVPLYEAKMIHHFDHRWATYADGAADDDEGARDCTLAEKQNPAFEPTPRYWVPEVEVKLRAARVPSSMKRGVREENPERVLKSLAEWLSGYFAVIEGRAMRDADLTRILGCGQAWRSSLGASPDRYLLDPKTQANGAQMQRETPLKVDDIAFLTNGYDDPLALAAALIDCKQPRWLMGWRDIALRSVERTVVGGMFPICGVGNSLPIWHLNPLLSPREVAALVSILTSIPFDFSGAAQGWRNSPQFFHCATTPCFASRCVLLRRPRYREEGRRCRRWIK